MEMSGILDGVRVLDLTTGIAGPITAMLLADHGADVVRSRRRQGPTRPVTSCGNGASGVWCPTCDAGRRDAVSTWRRGPTS